MTKGLMKIYNLNYLRSLSPDNAKFMMEIIKLFLKQVPISLAAMNKSHATGDWAGLQYSAHQIGSHFDCLDIQKKYRTIARKIEKYAKEKQNLDLIPVLVLELENSFEQAQKGLNEELKTNFSIIY